MAAEHVGRALGVLWISLRSALGLAIPARPRQGIKTDSSASTCGEDRESEWRLPPIPAGFQILESRIQVAGLLHRKVDCVAFVRHLEEHSLEFELDPTNPYDKNAIKIIGLAGAERFHLGFVPSPIAKQLADKGLRNLVGARLERAFVSREDYVDIIFQIIGPKSARASYQD